ncbi:MAG: heme lyase CcmF/NrfE family subunit [Acidobacteria bacterium]|nr:MAG: heme lyase CcmF/NrfE family subunit [Acidobacteriota bacterium]REK12132.1 MAG: heme lyase CcmF/NrfE family subunit [Acidobacteriota bacterium]
MYSTLGQALVLVALLCCCVGAPLGFAAGARESATALRWTRRLAIGFGIAMLAANLVMEVALLQRDFSVSYVAQVGSTATPTVITIVSLWSSLEGSILFWGLVLGLYTIAITVLQRRGHDEYLGYTLGVVLAVGIFFSYLIAGPANPFAPTPPPVPAEGPGPNPLLQNHWLMIWHPPTLYLGYVGMTIPFAMAMAALLRGQLGATWLRPLRRWLLVPTAFLTLGLMLGGWWSYEVLGWGGYWAWDPVENASFLPWLTAIAALHSAIVQQRKGTLKAWTVILILVTFLLTILGTFLTRSGVVNSVHSFTQSPIGPLFLVFLALCMVAVVVLLALRIDTLSSSGRTSGLASREGSFLLNNLILVSIMFTVLVGTLFPIAAEAVRGVKVSVGEPYFNRMSVPLFLALLLLMGIGPALPWGTSDPRLARKVLLRPLPSGLVAAVLFGLVFSWQPMTVFVGFLVGYTLWVTADQALRPARARASRGESLPTAAVRSSLVAPQRLGAYVVHFGVVMTFAAVAISSQFQTEAEGTLRRGESLQVADYSLAYQDVQVIQEPHLARQLATIEVRRDGELLGTLDPSLNFYPTQREPLGTPSVLTSATHDLYLTLMNVRQGGDTIGLRAIVTPAVVWIWVGVVVMVVGTTLCVLPAPLPLARRHRDPVAEPAEA